MFATISFHAIRHKDQQMEPKFYHWNFPAVGVFSYFFKCSDKKLKCNLLETGLTYGDRWIGNPKSIIGACFLLCLPCNELGTCLWYCALLVYSPSCKDKNSCLQAFTTLQNSDLDYVRVLILLCQLKTYLHKVKWGKQVKSKNMVLERQILFQWSVYQYTKQHCVYWMCC